MLFNFIEKSGIFSGRQHESNYLKIVNVLFQTLEDLLSIKLKRYLWAVKEIVLSLFAFYTDDPDRILLNSN